VCSSDLIEAFINIDTLNCSNNQLTSLDISHNTALTNLDCSINQLTSLDISNDTNLLNLNLSSIPTLDTVCVWKMPFLPADTNVNTTESPNVYFSADCMTEITGAYKEEKGAHYIVNHNDSALAANELMLNKSDRESTFHFGFGGGFCLPGSVWGINWTFLSAKQWGGNIRLNTNIYKSKNVPADYFDDENRVLAPKDYISSVSFNVVNSFNSNNKSIRFGFELGPSWVIYRKAEFKFNPGYDPSGNNILGGYYLYEKSHTRSNTLGLSLRAKMEFLVRRHTGFELAAFACFNKYKSVLGLEMDFMIGKIGYRK
jgi:hypothetical protein